MFRPIPLPFSNSLSTPPLSSSNQSNNNLSSLNGSNLFSLTDKDMPKMRLLVSTQSEFPGRPGVGSVYSICWTFTQGEGYLGYLLAREVGTLTYEEIDALVNRLVERTDGLSVKYSNLWK